MSVGQTVMISVISSTVTVGVLAFIVKEFFRRSIESGFSRRDLQFSKQKDLEFTVRGNVINTRLGVYPEIAEVVYRLRNLARDALATNDPFTWGKPQFSDCCYHLTENLYKYRVFMPEETFATLHKFKRTAQDFLIRTDFADRPEALSDRPRFSSAALASLRDLSSTLDALSEEILQELQKQVEGGLQPRDP